MSTLQVNEITDTGGHTLLGRKNAIINGNFDVWQRGTSQTATGYGSADRWRSEVSGSSQSVTQQTFTVGQTDVPYNPKYYYRNVVTTGGGASNYVTVSHRIEDVTNYSGETVTLSFYAKADASKDIAFEFTQNFGSGSTDSQLNTYIDTISLTSSWAKYTVTFIVPSVAGKDVQDSSWGRVLFWLDAGSDFNARTNSLGNQSGTFEFAQVQLEAGSVATPFERRSYGEELALCRRYFETNYPVGSSLGDIIGDTVQTGIYFRTGSSSPTAESWFYAVPKRAQASVTIYNGVTGATGSWRGSSSADITPSVYGGDEYNFRTAFTNLNSLIRSAFYAADAEL